MTEQYPKSDGALWLNMDNQDSVNLLEPFLRKFKGDSTNLPQHRGRIKVTKEQIRKLIEMSKAGLEPTIQIGSWFRHPKNGGAPYIFVSTEVYMKNEEQQQNQGYQKPQLKQQQTPYQPPQQQASEPFEDDDLPF